MWHSKDTWSYAKKKEEEKNQRSEIWTPCSRFHWLGRLGSVLDLRLHELESHLYSIYSYFERQNLLLKLYQLKFVVHNRGSPLAVGGQHALCRMGVFNHLGMDVSYSWTVNGCLNLRMPVLSLQQISTVQDVQILRRSIWGSPVETSTWITSSMYF